jgi:hypothetical protein
MRVSGLFILLLLVVSIPLNAEESSGNRYFSNSETPVRSLVQSGRFIFTAGYAYKRSGQKVTLHKGYDMRIDRNFVSCWLPLTDHGLKFSDSSGTEPLQFMGNADQVKTYYDERNNVSVVAFQVYAEPNYLNIEIHVSDSGNAWLTILSNDRTYFRFEGKIERVASTKKTV